MTESPMLTMCGQVVKVFENPGSVDKQTGDVREPRMKVQMLCNIPLKNGQSRLDLQTLATDDEATFRELLGETVRLPIGIFVRGQTAFFYALKGSKPEVL